MRFENGMALNYLWLILLLGIVIYLVQQWRNKKILKQFSQKNFLFLTRSVSLRKQKIKWTLQLGTLALILVALARPQLGQGVVDVKQEGFEVMLLVDVSSSMMAEDLKPSRLALAKLDLERLIDRLPGFRIGLVAFAGSAAVLSPLTNDPGALKMYIDSLDPESVSAQGTSFEAALKMAAVSFENGGVDTDSTSQVTRVVLMVSDGEDHEPGALEAAKEMANKNIRLFTVAYGTEKGAAIPVRDQMGYMRGYKQDNQQNAVISQVNGEALRELANAGNGTFSFAVVGGNHLIKIVEDFSQLEKSEYDSSTATQYQEKYQMFLLVALILALIELALGERKNLSAQTRIWKGRLN